MGKSGKEIKLFPFHLWKYDDVLKREEYLRSLFQQGNI